MGRLDTRERPGDREAGRRGAQGPADTAVCTWGPGVGEGAPGGTPAAAPLPVQSWPHYTPVHAPLSLCGLFSFAC